GAGFDFTQIYGKQLLFIMFTIPLVFVVLALDGKFYEKYASIIFAVALLLLVGLFPFGKTIAGQRCWYAIGSFTIQPSEFCKAATALALAKYLSDVQVNLKDFKQQIIAIVIIALPIILILPQPDPGSALIYTVFFIALYREGLLACYLWTAFIAILLFVLTLIFDPIYLVLAAAVIIAIIYLRSRKINRNIVASAIVLLLMSGFTFSVDYVFENIFKQ